MRKETFLRLGKGSRWRAGGRYPRRRLHHGRGVPAPHRPLRWARSRATAGCRPLRERHPGDRATDAIRYRFGLRISEDVGVTGFDDIPLAASPAYALTTYRQPIEEMATALVRLLLASSETSEPVILNGRFIPRRSA
jgi:hypothetical protein